MILAVLCAVVAALWIAVGSIPRKPPAPAPTPVQTAAPTPSPTAGDPAPDADARTGAGAHARAQHRADADTVAGDNVCTRALPRLTRGGAMRIIVCERFDTFRG